MKENPHNADLYFVDECVHSLSFFAIDKVRFCQTHRLVQHITDVHLAIIPY